MTRIVHVVPEINEANGVWRVASLLAQDQGGVVMQAAAPALSSAITLGEEVWVHGAWLPCLWRAAHFAMRSGCRLVRMTHGSLSPIYLCRQSPLKKRLVSPVERFFLRRADRVIATCQTETEWIRTFEPHVRSIEVVDLKRFFNLPNSKTQPPSLSIPQLDSAALHAAHSRSAPPSSLCAPPFLAELPSSQLDSAALPAAPPRPIPPSSFCAPPFLAELAVTARAIG